MSNFTSVKLSNALVDQARESAQALRRSVASQIECWAAIGQAVEHSGLTVKEAQQAIASYKAAARQTHLRDADPLLSRFMSAETDGSLAKRVRQVIADNVSKASKAQ